MFLDSLHILNLDISSFEKSADLNQLACESYGWKKETYSAGLVKGRLLKLAVTVLEELYFQGR